MKTIIIKTGSLKDFSRIELDIDKKSEYCELRIYTPDDDMVGIEVQIADILKLTTAVLKEI